ncbi:TetR/AcrR family transcriptional regulator [Nocardioides humilatus]|uniref:TetR/AcrR family transcriptional regulator n=1 Tax=Nocardioides humilatus TaxID=2607660 RepID=A0A5B1LMG7_9ACTN|nr:TetR/AcrR family transcriptional regulator [Nocardioides humilatus]KAA1421872.1 TetR/AcrR family transcriptional regulator [Nocardioides humilatus]
MAGIRRSPYRRGEARAAVLEHARVVFAERGYHAASLAEVAARADVSETLVYRYFGSKAGLFEESIIGPGRDFVDQFLASWEERSDQPDLEEKVRELVVALLGFVQENRGMIVAWALAESQGPREIATDGIHGQGVRRLAAALTGHADPDAEMAVSLGMGVILAVVTFTDVLFAADSPNRAPGRLTEAVTQFVLAGFLARLDP